MHFGQQRAAVGLSPCVTTARWHDRIICRSESGTPSWRFGSDDALWQAAASLVRAPPEGEGTVADETIVARLGQGIAVWNRWRASLRPLDRSVRVRLDLRNADLHRADLSRADLSDADLENADLAMQISAGLISVELISFAQRSQAPTSVPQI
jgi:hypothetical protein